MLLHNSRDLQSFSYCAKVMFGDDARDWMDWMDTSVYSLSALTFNMRAGSQVSSPRQGLNKLFPIIMMASCSVVTCTVSARSWNR